MNDRNERSSQNGRTSQNGSLRSAYIAPPAKKSTITVGNVQDDYESVHRDARTAINRTALKLDSSEISAELRSVSHWLTKPIDCGYLLAFSRTEYNSENVRFLMAMENFKDHMDMDPHAWSSDTWQEIDQRIEIDKEMRDEDLDDELLWDKHLDTKLWPSAKIAIDSVAKHVQMIWDTYFSSTASSEICNITLPFPASSYSCCYSYHIHVTHPSPTLPNCLHPSLPFPPFPSFHSHHIPDIHPSFFPPLLTASLPPFRYLCQDACTYRISSTSSTFIRTRSIYRSDHRSSKNRQQRRASTFLSQWILSRFRSTFEINCHITYSC